MDIYEALEKLDGFFDALANYGECTDEELELMGEIEDTIYQFARKYEPRAEDLPMEFTCTCGEHLIRNDIVDDSAMFVCPKCDSVWYLGRPI